jgi:tRNA dimethylallyltransferase
MHIAEYSFGSYNNHDTKRERKLLMYFCIIINNILKQKITLPFLLGPTASGKTRLAAFCADKLHCDIIGADSRHVYTNMDIGTGKDYEDYIVDDKHVPYHLIDIVPAGYKYNLYEYQRDFKKVYSDIIQQKRNAIVCGGTGLYLESIINNYSMHEVPEDAEFRASCDGKDINELKKELESLKTLHNTSDIDTRKRAIRAIEIARYEKQYGVNEDDIENLFTPLVIGVDISRETRISRIDARLGKRIDEGLIPEVEQLIINGVDHETLQYYGLEYKFTSLFLLGELSKVDYVSQLRTAIHRFAKRQMTWFRGMERRGIHIHWINGELPMERRVEEVLGIIKSNS